MNTDASMMTAPDSFHGSNPLSSTSSEAGTMMTCETCDLVGGPFPAAEAAHLRAIHDRLHHGMLFAA
jgi:hypothetical protein